MRSPLYRKTLTILLTLPLWLLSSCIESTTTVHVGKDGAGTIVERTAMGAQAVQMIKQFSQGFGNALGGDAAAAPSIPDNPLMGDADSYRDRATRLGEGVTFESAEEFTDPSGSLGVLVTYAFEDIRKVRLSAGDVLDARSSLENLMPGAAAAAAPALPKGPPKDPITFDFSPGSVASLTILMPKPSEEDLASREKLKDLPEGGGPVDANQMVQVSQMLGNMEFALKVSVDGRVLESNATHQQASDTTLFSMRMGEMFGDPGSLTKLQALKNEKDFEAIKSALEDVKGMKFESRETVEIKFR